MLNSHRWIVSWLNFLQVVHAIVFIIILLLLLIITLTMRVDEIFTSVHAHAHPPSPTLAHLPPLTSDGRGRGCSVPYLHSITLTRSPASPLTHALSLTYSTVLVMAEGGVAVFLTFHSGEDRRVKKHFKQGQSSLIVTTQHTLVIIITQHSVIYHTLHRHMSS